MKVAEILRVWCLSIRMDVYNSYKHSFHASTPMGPRGAPKGLTGEESRTDGTYSTSVLVIKNVDFGGNF